MNGQLFDIIFNFFLNLFFSEYEYASIVDLGYDRYNDLYAIFIQPYMSLSSLTNYWHDVVFLGNEIPNFYVYIICHIFSSIVIIFLIILLFKLFKWIFNLVFKLFRLN